MKFKLDENMPGDLATLLAGHGHDVHTVHDEGLAGEPDPDILQAAISEDRILITFDLDFADIRSFPPGSHRGIVVMRVNDHRWSKLEPLVQRIIDDNALDTLGNGLAIVDEYRVRFRRESQ